MNPRKVKMFVQGYLTVKNNRPGVGLKLSAFYFNMSVFQPPPRTLLMYGSRIPAEISQIPLYLRVLSCSLAILVRPLRLLQQRMKTRGQFNAY